MVLENEVMGGAIGVGVLDGLEKYSPWHALFKR